jgi:hypothetical protein
VIGIRWTIGDVSPRGFTALALSAWGAYRLFGPGAEYAAVVNTVSLDEAARRVGPLPPPVRLVQAHGLPRFLRRARDRGMAEGVAWKFAPLRLFPELPELTLDNDCILWDEPEALRRWRAQPGSGLFGGDVRVAYGRFQPLLPAVAGNSGMRGIPARFDLGAALERALAEAPGPLRTELDEQGLQLLALRRALPVHVVSVDEVTICSPFPPHRPDLGRAGVHFVGLNPRAAGFSVEGQPGEALIADHFDRLRPEVERRIGLPAPERWAPGAAFW